MPKVGAKNKAESNGRPTCADEAQRLYARGFSVVPSSDYEERRLTHRIYHPQMTTEWLQEHWWYTLGDSDLV